MSDTREAHDTLASGPGGPAGGEVSGERTPAEIAKGIAAVERERPEERDIAELFRVKELKEARLKNVLEGLTQKIKKLEAEGLEAEGKDSVRKLMKDQAEKIQRWYDGSAVPKEPHEEIEGEGW